MDPSNPLAEAVADKTGASPCAQVEEPAPSERQSVYQLTGATPGSRRLGAWESFIPLVMLGSLEWLGHSLESILHVKDDPRLAVAPALKAIGGKLPSVLGDWSARNVVVLSSLAFFVVAFGTFSTAWYVIFEALEHAGRRRRTMIGIAAVGLGVFLFMRRFEWDGDASITIARLQQQVGTLAGIGICPLYRFLYATGQTVLFCAACAMCGVLLPNLDDDSKPGSQKDIAFLGRRMRWARAMVYVIGLFLAVSTLVSYAATSTISVYLLDADDQAAMLHMSSRSTLMFATLYSIVLFCMYAPTEAILRVRAMKVASDAHVKVGERAAWLTDKGLRLSAVDQLKAVLAVLSPILVDLLRQSVSGLLKG